MALADPYPGARRSLGFYLFDQDGLLRGRCVAYPTGRHRDFFGPSIDRASLELYRHLEVDNRHVFCDYLHLGLLDCEEATDCDRCF